MERFQFLTAIYHRHHIRSRQSTFRLPSSPQTPPLYHSRRSPVVVYTSPQMDCGTVERTNKHPPNATHPTPPQNYPSRPHQTLLYPSLNHRSRKRPQEPRLPDPSILGYPPSSRPPRPSRKRNTILPPQFRSRPPSLRRSQDRQGSACQDYGHRACGNALGCQR